VDNDRLFLVAILAVVMVAGLATTLRFVRGLIEARQERQIRISPEAFAALSQRLDRIENAVETTALEVERISEANRFMAKLLAERGATVPASAAVPKPERVITPH